ncbi:hypothetical protein GCM10023194_34580 [Planotetraspora phitsanulokensis]|uniref:CU044_5270 family protein n=1 Tax=Planotetraspora phitsanulokensis TaxID=575192 RepID=A0A8J3U0K1_9ACTN|nr:CU044_5270 family protein [Planotetraspora phitsanulokensis]GII36413.1 hypothetical protein Pph01_14160 [Planotetraspora phitsanulokensis]
MDDLKMVRDVYGEIAPDPQLETRIRARLAHEGGRSSSRPGFLRGRARVGLGLLATAAAAAVAVTAVGIGNGGGAGTSPVAGAPTTELSAKSILLAAADQAANEPTGRFWRLHMISGSSGRVEGATPYTVFGPNEFDGWRSPSAQETDYTFQRDLAAYPLTAADKSAWKAAGSPASFKVRNNEDFFTYTLADGAWTTKRITPEVKKSASASFKQLCARADAAAKCPPSAQLTWAEKEKIASDPARFQELLFPQATSDPAGRLFQGFYFLIEQPASPEIRAKAFRALADLPGVRGVGKVKSLDGRTGVGIAAEGKMIDGSGATYEYQIILDPKTNKVIGDKQTIVGGTYRGLGPGTVLTEQSVMQAGWTGDTPHHG